MEEMTQIDDEIKDAVGEIVNTVCGQVKTKMAEKGKTCNVKLKDVLMNEALIIEHLKDKPVIVVPFSSSKGNFEVEICIG